MKNTRKTWEEQIFKTQDKLQVFKCTSYRDMQIRERNKYVNEIEQGVSQYKIQEHLV